MNEGCAEYDALILLGRIHVERETAGVTLQPLQRRSPPMPCEGSH